MLEDPTVESDNAAIRRVLGGETAAFEVLVERHSRRVLGTCIKITRDRDAAEDCMQVSLITAFERLGQFRAEAPFSAWLTRIAVNVALSHLRREKPARMVERPIEGGQDGWLATPVPDPHPDPEAALYRRELHELLREEIEALPIKMRTVLVLRDLQGLNTFETARALGITQEAVKARLFRAHRTIQRRLERLND